ncbi:MAG: F0F1 ATP synthase subunit delta [Campylobacterota bacterium]|nr:F0F1 ATP synthase subunit delta [Campylobacterota bacterium]
MSNLVAKRYVKALLDGRDIESASAVAVELNTISKAYAQDKFVEILMSTEVDSKAKEDLIFSLVDNCSDTTKNLIKVLNVNKRLDIINVVSDELNKDIAVLTNNFTGVIYTNNKLLKKYVTSIEKQFSKKFGVELALTQNVCDYDGIKVDIEGLGVEIAFSKDRLKSQMMNHILKAV